MIKKILTLTIALVLSLINLISSQPPSDYVAYWKFDDDLSDGVADDSSAYNNDGVCSGASCPALTAGISGQAYSFDGINDSIDATQSGFWSAIFRNGEDFTISAWVYPDSLGNYAIVAQRYSTTISFVFKNTGRTEIRYDDTSVYSTGTVNIEQWSHAVVTVRMISSTNYECIMYINGVQSGSGNCYNDLAGTQEDLLFVGWQSRADRQSDATYFNGKIDEVMIFNRDLSADEINEIYSAGTGGGDGCSNKVVEPNGADGIPGTDDDEECDDGNLINGDGCSASCKNEDLSCSGNYDYDSEWLCMDTGYSKPCELDGSKLFCSDWIVNYFNPSIRGSSPNFCGVSGSYYVYFQTNQKSITLKTPLLSEPGDYILSFKYETGNQDGESFSVVCGDSAKTYIFPDLAGVGEDIESWRDKSITCDFLSGVNYIQFIGEGTGSVHFDDFSIYNCIKYEYGGVPIESSGLSFFSFTNAVAVIIVITIYYFYKARLHRQY